MTDVLWPDFALADFHRAILAFGARDRRFGGLGMEVADAVGGGTGGGTDAGPRG